ncbi:uncharacterized protein [Prorops nasuta]|uniref:uncharacterized protein n=1 Tax=Prorops nasuta TaxID=863751 RepID=UPI0034CE9848
MTVANTIFLPKPGYNIGPKEIFSYRLRCKGLEKANRQAIASGFHLPWLPYSPQRGSPRSGTEPFVFNLYLHDILHHIHQDVTVLQYADDIAVFCDDYDVANVELKLDRTLTNLHDWLSSIDLELCPDKSKYVLFNRLTIPGTTHIKMIDAHPPNSEFATFLGITLSFDLNFNRHLKNTLDKINKNFNFLHYLSKIKWGPHPIIMHRYLNATILSIIHWNLSNITLCNKSFIKRFEIQIRKFSRLILRLMPSTPVPIVTDIYKLYPIETKINFLLDCYICRMKTIAPNTLLNKLNNYRALIDSKKLSYNNHSTLVHRLHLSTLSHDSDLYINSHSLPLPYNYDWTVLAYSFENDTHTIFQSCIPKKQQNQIQNTNNNKFESYALNITNTCLKAPNACMIYTDGATSKTHIASFTVFCQNPKKNILGRLPNHYSTLNAELYAILKAIELSKNLEIPSLIITDSKFAINQINKPTFLKVNNSILTDIKSLLSRLNRSSKREGIVWCPARSGIDGNLKYLEIEDVNNKLKYLFDEQIQKTRGKLNVDSSSFNKYFSFIRNSNNKLTSRQAKINNGKNPWFYNFPDLSRKQICIISRIRTNHNACSSHLHKIKLSASPICDCNGTSRQDINQFFWWCCKWKEQRNKLLDSLKRKNIIKKHSFPNAQHLSFSTDHDVLKAMVKYVNDTTAWI